MFVFPSPRLVESKTFHELGQWTLTCKLSGGSVFPICLLVCRDSCNSSLRVVSHSFQCIYLIEQQGKKKKRSKAFDKKQKKKRRRRKRKKEHISQVLHLNYWCRLYEYYVILVYFFCVFVFWRKFLFDFFTLLEDSYSLSHVKTAELTGALYWGGPVNMPVNINNSSHIRLLL